MHRLAVSCSVLVFTSLGCAKPEPPPPPPPGPPAAVQVVATDFAFQFPDTLTAGPTTFTLVNNGAEMHHIQIIRLDEGKTAADVAAIPPGTIPPSWAVLVGGPNGAVPGGQVRGTVDLTAGNYVMLCFIPSPAPDMRGHHMKGMMRPFTVLPASETRVAAAPHFTVTLNDYSFVFSAPIPAGEHDVKVVNAGPQAHEVLFVKLAPGKQAADLLQWFGAGMQGPPPGEAVGGTTGIAPNGENIVHINFTPGEYAMYCFVEDVKDLKMHFEHGMVSQFTVQ